MTAAQTTMEKSDRLKELDEQGEFPERWAPEPGDGLAGIVRRYTDVDLEKSGLTRIVTLELEEGDVVSVFLSPTVLKSEFKKLRPKIGERVFIRFLGTPPGKSYKKFVVRCPDRQTEAEPDWDSYDADDGLMGTPAPRRPEPAPRMALQSGRRSERLNPPPGDPGHDPFDDDEF